MFEFEQKTSVTENTITVITDLDRICRTCLCEKTQEEMTSLYEDSLEDMLFRLTAIKVK